MKFSSNTIYPPPYTHNTVIVKSNNPLISFQTNGSSLPAAGSLVSCRSCSNCRSLPKWQACPHPRTRGAQPGGARERDQQIQPINSEEVEFTAAPTFPSPDCPPKPGLNFMPEIRRFKATLWVFVCLTHLSIMARVTAGGSGGEGMKARDEEGRRERAEEA